MVYLCSAWHNYTDRSSLSARLFLQGLLFFVLGINFKADGRPGHGSQFLPDTAGYKVVSFPLVNYQRKYVGVFLSVIV